MADVVLPASQWGEKNWTSTNSERMVSFSPKLWDAPGEALPDSEILCRFAKKMGYSGFDYSSSSDIWDEFIQLTKDRPCDMSGMQPAAGLRDGSLQWPCPNAYHYGTKRRYTDHVFPTPDGKAIFLRLDPSRPKRNDRSRVPLCAEHRSALLPLAHSDPLRKSREAREA